MPGTGVMRHRALDLVARYARARQPAADHGVDQLTHALQCAALASAETSDSEIVLSALLHDVGHVLLHDHVWHPERPELHHGRVGAMLVRPFTSARVAWLVESHVDTRLCFAGDAEPRLSPERHSWLADAVRIRQWDRAAKHAPFPPPPLIAYRTVLESQFGPQTWSDAPGIGTVVHGQFTAS
jgi:predicted HD phosphohydrolase